ncbi:MAG: glycosyltransferase [Cytophagaceae bacterium]|jgi:hypothetical protein|nr:glycosyltransferase [Cytophagaceae bacterium]
MELIELIVWIGILSYGAFISFLIIGWRRVKKKYPLTQPLHYPMVDVIIALRNESDSIEALLQQLSAQDYPGGFTVWCVDDESTDGTRAKLDAWLNRFSSLRVLTSSGKGKKAALQTAINVSTAPWLVFTDADCTMGPRWIQEMMRMHEHKSFLSGPVRMTSNSSIFQQLQQVEFSSLVGVGLSAIGWQKAIMCNGANIAIRRSVFEQVGGYSGNEAIASGDDTFLMHKVALWNRSQIGAVLHTEAIVHTLPTVDWNTFYHQRKRWAGKWGRYRLGFVNLLAVWVFVFQLGLFCTPMLALWGYISWTLVGIAWGLRLLADFIYLQSVVKFLSNPFNIVIFIGMACIYPMYAIGFGILARMGSYQWKERSTQ